MSTEEMESNRYGKVQWFFFIILIPTIFSLILVGVILAFLGVNVTEKVKTVGQQIPGLSSYLRDDEQLVEEGIAEGPSLDELTETIAMKQAEVTKLTQVASEQEAKIRSLQEQILQLEEQLVNERENEAAVNEKLAEIGKVYEAMSAKNAANIITELSTEEAVTHLLQISTQNRAAIMAKMSPEQAAILMTQLTNLQ